MTTRIGIAFQGGGFPAGAIGAGVVRRLVEEGVFERYQVDAFSGTSAGALVASVCWACMLQNNMKEAPKILEKQWMHFAWGLVPNAEVAQLDQLLDALARKNPVYEYCADNFIVPFLRQLMKEWVLAYIPVDELAAELKRKKANSEHIPSLLLGAADILRGEVKVFTENDFCLEAILASGSLDEVNGITEIKDGPNKGIFCDGAWGTNPPLTQMLDCKVDEIWFVEVFPKIREKIPRTPGERKDRKDELWQNSLVEHELRWIEKVNEWLDSGMLVDPRKRHVQIRKMPMKLDLPAGAAFVNSPSFIKDMMGYGYKEAAVFLA